MINPKSRTLQLASLGLVLGQGCTTGGPNRVGEPALGDGATTDNDSADDGAGTQDGGDPANTDPGDNDGPTGDDAPGEEGDPDGDSHGGGAVDTGDDDGPDPFVPTATGCITSTVAGVNDYDCDGLVTTVSVPAHCLEAPCGVILDVHGASMSAQQQDNNTNMRALGVQYGYIVVQPTTDGFSWSAGHQQRIMTGVFDVIDAFDADEDRVHVTGFSAGGGVTWVVLCAYPEVFASAAPAAATGQYLGSAPVCFGTAPPSPELDILYINGLTDPFETMDYVNSLVGKIVVDYSLDAGAVIDGDGTWERLRRTNASGTVFDFITHSYETDQSIIGQSLAGHCYPGSTDHSPTLPGQLAGYGCKGANGFHFGETVIEFFVQHPK